MTNNITVPRELLRQALELLQGAVAYDWHGNPAETFDKECVKTTEALRLALDAPAVEPVALLQLALSGDALADFRAHKWWVDALEMAVVDGTVKQKLAVDVLRNLIANLKVNLSRQPAPTQKLFTDLEKQQPRKAVKLTDHQISAIAIANPPNVHIYARAIEQAVWEKLGVTK